MSINYQKNIDKFRNYSIRVVNLEEKRAAVEFLKATTGITEIWATLDVMCGEFVFLSSKSGSNQYAINGGILTSNKKVNFDQIHTLLLEPNFIKVVLNKEYTAEVSKDQISVGCQTFPASKVKELQDAINKLNS